MIKTEQLSVVSEISPLEAYDILRADKRAILLDVRSKMEFDYVGHPEGSINVPWQNPPNWQLNANFLDEVKLSVKQHVPDQQPEETLILAMCRSGKRSLDAATYLKESGFNKVINIVEGFEGDLDANKRRGNINGWRYHNLPWEQT